MIDDPDPEDRCGQRHDSRSRGIQPHVGDTATRTDGVEDVEDGMGAVELTSSGTGEVVYNVGMTSSEVNEEWVKLTVTFVWEAGGEMPAGVGSGYVDVSFHPVSSLGGVSFDDGGAKMPRFVASNDPVKVVAVDDCVTTLLFPFVTNRAQRSIPEWSSRIPRRTAGSTAPSITAVP